MAEDDLISFEEKMLLNDYECLYLNYVKRNCLSCINAKQNEKNKCGHLYGGSKPSCLKMERWIHKVQKEKKEKIIQEWIKDLVPQDSETNLAQSFSY